MKLFVRKAGGRQVSSSQRLRPNYYSSGVKESPKTPVKRKKSLKWKSWLIGIAVVLVFLLAVSISSKPTVSADSAVYHNQAYYSQGVSKLFGSWQNRTKITLNQAALKNKIEAQYPEVKEVKISTPIYSRQAKIELKIAQPTFTLSGAPGTFGADSRYLIAANGKVVGLLAESPGIKDLPNLTDQVGIPIKRGELVLGQSTADFILTIIAQAKQKNIPVDSFVLAKNSQEIDLRTKDKKYFVKFNLSADPATQIGQYLAAREQLAKTGDPAEYLDVRVDGRIFYK